MQLMFPHAISDPSEEHNVVVMLYGRSGFHAKKLSMVK